MSRLNIYLEQYLKLRRQLGFKLRDGSRLLRLFVLFAKSQHASVITVKLALRWAVAPKTNPRLSSTRLSVVRRFAEYVSAIDSRTEVPAQGLLPSRYIRRAPHLYRQHEVIRLVKAAQKIDPQNPIKGATYSTLFGLLAVTGMRLNEAIQLDRADVDLVSGLLTIRRAKGNKSRLVPLHISTQHALRRYAQMRDKIHPCPISSRFFVAERGTAPHSNTVDRWFLLVAYAIGLRRPGDNRGPRLHDLRHHFAVQTLLHWYRTGVDVEVHLPELSTYLGHAHVRDTYWYLSATPELLRLVTRRLELKEAGR